MSYTAPTISQFKSQFFRDFPYGTDPNDTVLDQDIMNAFNLVDVNINQDLWDSQQAYTVGYLLYSAHFLVLSLRNSSQGLNGQYGWAQNNKAVGAVSEGLQIPEEVQKNGLFMMLTKTQYGGLYLQQIWPKLRGQMFSVYGRTKP